ncbi:unnamed protein product [Rhodiola kirilowii]
MSNFLCFFNGAETDLCQMENADVDKDGNSCSFAKSSGSEDDGSQLSLREETEGGQAKIGPCVVQGSAAEEVVPHSFSAISAGAADSKILDREENSLKVPETFLEEDISWASLFVAGNRESDRVSLEVRNKDMVVRKKGASAGTSLRKVQISEEAGDRSDNAEEEVSSRYSGKLTRTTKMARRKESKEKKRVLYQRRKNLRVVGTEKVVVTDLAPDQTSLDKETETREQVRRRLQREVAERNYRVALRVGIKGSLPEEEMIQIFEDNLQKEYNESGFCSVLVLWTSESRTFWVDRIDLTNLKVYAIDVDEADELDDALSATRLQDGRIKIWIHVADPTRFVVPGSKVDRDAVKRGTSIFLPTVTYPMFPEKLAMEGMSLRQGHICNSVTVSVILRDDGSIAEYSIFNSTIRPTYMLTYESASELLHLSLEEESELKILSEAATLRLQWRRHQGAVDVANIETRIKVANPEDPDPPIKLYVENQSDPAMRLVSEMMILCGEAVATYGCANNIPLPYRGQPQSNIDPSAFAHLPEGPVRSSALVKIMRAAEMDFRKPVRHGILGIPGYVQFTSPIRRYMDLLAHYQVKAFLRGESLPFTAGQLEGMASMVNMNTRIAKKLFSSSLRYWMLEYMKRQPKERRFTALILRFIKDRIAALLLVEVGLQSSAWVSVGKQIGDEVEVRVEESHPRDDILSLKEV